MIKKQKAHLDMDLEKVKGMFPKGIQKEKEELSRIFNKEDFGL